MFSRRVAALEGAEVGADRGPGRREGNPELLPAIVRESCDVDAVVLDEVVVPSTINERDVAAVLARVYIRWDPRSIGGAQRESLFIREDHIHSDVVAQRLGPLSACCSVVLKATEAVTGV